MIQPKQEIPSICLEPAIWWISVAFSYFLPFCVCCTRVSMQVLILRNTHVKARGWHGCILYCSLSLSVSQQNLFRFSWGASKLSGSACLHPAMWCWLLSSWNCAQLLCGCWGLKLRSFCLISNLSEREFDFGHVNSVPSVKKTSGTFEVGLNTFAQMTRNLCRSEVEDYSLKALCLNGKLISRLVIINLYC